MGAIKIKSIYFKVILITFIVIPILLFIWKTDFNQIGLQLHYIGLQFTYLLAITFLAYLLGTYSWYVCLQSYRTKISIFQLFSIRQIGETVGVYNPTSVVGGDYVKVEMLTKLNIRQKVAVQSVVVSRITAILSQLLLVFIILLWILFKQIPNSSIYSYGLYVLSLLLLIVQVLLFIWLSSPLKQHHDKPSNLNFFKKLWFNIRQSLIDVKTFFKTQQKAFWYSYILSLLHWIVGGLEFYLILIILGIDTTVMHGILLDMTVLIIKSLAAFIPGQIGVEELGNKFALSTIGISSATIWLTVSILRRARQIFWILIGFLLYFLNKHKTIISPI